MYPESLFQDSLEVWQSLCLFERDGIVGLAPLCSFSNLFSQPQIDVSVAHDVEYSARQGDTCGVCPPKLD